MASAALNSHNSASASGPGPLPEGWQRTTDETIARLRTNANAVTGGSELSMMAVPGFLTSDECDHLISQCDKAGYRDSKGALDHSARGSQSCKASFFSDDVVKFGSVPEVEDLLDRMGRLVGLNAHKQMEYSELIRYAKGGEYRVHLDSGPQRKQPRPVTMFLYLNTLDEEDGGCTHFTDLGIKVRPEKGTASLLARAN
jgi:hypothetical protein